MLEQGVAEVSLRPLAAAIGSSPRVLLFLFDSKDGLMQALMQRARAEELELIGRVRASEPDGDLLEVARALWEWLAAPRRRALLRLWAERYGSSLVYTEGPWAGFARSTVEDWLELLACAQPPRWRRTRAGQAERTAVLALLRGALMDLLATGEQERATAAVMHQLQLIGASRRARGS